MIRIGFRVDLYKVILTAAPSAPAPLSATSAPAVELQSPATTAPSREHLEQIVAARARAKSIHRAAVIATVGGWATGIFGALTLLTGIFSVTGLILGAGMLAVSYFEFRGARGLRRLDHEAPVRLALNQIGFALLLMGYAISRLSVALTGPGMYADAIAQTPELAPMIAPVDQLTRLIAICVYGMLILIAVFVQGGTALYYFTRRPHLSAYIFQTPRWILDLQRAGLSL